MLCASGLRGGVGDDRFAVADDDALTGERLELGGQIAGATILVDPGFVVCGPELAEVEVGVREQVVDDGQHRITDGDDGLELTATPGQPPVSGTQEGVGACGAEHDPPDGAGQPGVALAAVCRTLNRAVPCESHRWAWADGCGWK